MHYHFSIYGLRSNSCVMVVRGCVCRCQYASAIYRRHPIHQQSATRHTFFPPCRSLTSPRLPPFPAPKKTTAKRNPRTHRLRAQLPVLPLHHPLLRPRYVNHPVDNRMRHMHAAGAELATERLRQSPQSEFAGREGRALRRAFEGGGRARED